VVEEVAEEFILLTYNNIFLSVFFNQFFSFFVKG